MAEDIPSTTDGVALQALAFKRKTFVCINFPGVVKNVDKALKTLGGETAIAKTYADPSKRLELKWRPGDTFCKANYGDPSKPSSILLKVKRRKCHRPDGQETYEYKAEIEGTIAVAYKFSGMADFQYLPVSVSRDGGEVQDLLPVLKLDGLIPRKEFLSRPAPLFIPPMQFSRIDTPADYMYRHDYTPRQPESNPSNFRPQHLLGSARRKRTIFTIFVNYEDETVPSKPMDGAESFLNSKWRNEEMKEMLKKLFEERPVWSKNAIMARFPREHLARLKYGLPLVAYYFLTGPWRTLWVKLGYDPRTDPKAKVYQVLDFRLRRSLSRGKTIEGIGRQRAEYTQGVPLKQMKRNTKVIHISSMEGDKEESPFKQVEESYFVFRSDVLPPLRQMYYQMCDIHDEEVQQLLHSNDDTEGACDKDNGFCVSGIMEKARGILYSHVDKQLKSLPIPIWKKISKPRKQPADVDADEDEGDEEESEEDFDEDEDDDDDDINEVDKEMLDPV